MRTCSLLQKQWIDSSVSCNSSAHQGVLGGHFHCPRHSVLWVSVNEDHAWTQVQGGSCDRAAYSWCQVSLNISLMVWWQRLAFSTSLCDRWNTSERAIWTRSQIRVADYPGQLKLGTEMCQTLVLADEYYTSSIYRFSLGYSTMGSLFLLSFSKHFLKTSFPVCRTALQH